jgi:hypothetical protein
MKKYVTFLFAGAVAVISALVLSCSNGDPTGTGSTTKEEKVVTQSYENPGSYTFNFSDAKPNSPAEIEVYALGGGGGGQGGAYNTGLSSFEGTGGGGGGGAAAYMKLTNVTEQVFFNIVVGRGGSGGSYTGGGLLDGAESGSPGTNGGETSVSWASQSIKLSAEGGTGGGGSGTLVSGGTGGRARPADLPTGNRYYIDGATANGGNGTAGILKSETTSEGGKAAVINKGSDAPFAGGNGARRTNSGRTDAQNGGGGSGGYDTQSGSSGGTGLVYILVKYYAEK